jgi:choline dehydrogenase-like flavoprotein
MTPPNSRKDALVLGTGIAGLLAARVLSEFYETVTIVERDELPDNPVQRKGIPQGRHVHAFTSGGSHVLGRLFPGLLDELVGAGANVWMTATYPDSASVTAAMRSRTRADSPTRPHRPPTWRRARSGNPCTAVPSILHVCCSCQFFTHLLAHQKCRPWTRNGGEAADDHRPRRRKRCG